MRKRSETAETQRKHNTKWRRMCQMLEKREQKKVKKIRQKRKENEATPNEIETFADSLKFPLLIMHGDNPNRSLLLLYPLHADWNPINAADGGETKKKRRKRRKNLQSFQLIFHPFPFPLYCHFLCGWAELLLRCCQAACSAAFDEQTTWKKGKCCRGRGLARCGEE